MSEVTEILRDARGGSQQNAEKLLSLVYTELKRIAVQKMAGEAPGHLNCWRRRIPPPRIWSNAAISLG
jgi:hypothetical protein